ncbi:uracil-xanthine permease family protein [Salidesulfovibrio brasiliensis]|uniref:uracil-xanthine permease family protein n=1 Tax=Salidesulfovibrio brasiliensis TaxID=221711 RepID=UPI0006CF5F14|nr:uracil-xanthine permease family protein [Salidesulfovibrio brasiliensis]
MSVHSTQYSFRPKDAFLGAQMLFVAFGALVLVPLLTGLNPNVALFTAGAGTLLFQIVTRGRVPVFLASSFAFIAPIIYGVETWGIPATLSGLAAAGVFYIILSFLIRFFGVEALRRVLPPVVTGPVIMVIGLVLAPVAVFMALGKTGDGSAVLIVEWKALIISLSALCTTILVSLLGRGWLKLIPILCGITVGYVASLILGVVSFDAIIAAPWLAVPDFVMPEFSWKAIMFIVPVAIAPAIEHFGDVLAIGCVTGKDYVKDPGVDKTMLGDGLATALASALGGPPNTTYSEVSGAVALTKVFNPGVMTWAAIAAMLLAFVSKLGAFLSTIPVPVMGGIMVLLFGAIMVVGMNTLVKAGHDLMEPRNLAIVAVIVIFGVGGMSLPFGGEFRLGGIGLAGVVGVVLNLVLPCKDCSEPLPQEKEGCKTD